MMFTRGFSLTNFAIGTSALCFQVFVLYPWHERLDDEFKALKVEHLRVLHAGESERRTQLEAIRKSLEELEKRKGGWLGWR